MRITKKLLIVVFPTFPPNDGLQPHSQPKQVIQGICKYPTRDASSNRENLVYLTLSATLMICQKNKERKTRHTSLFYDYIIYPWATYPHGLFSLLQLRSDSWNLSTVWRKRNAYRPSGQKWIRRFWRRKPIWKLSLPWRQPTPQLGVIRSLFSHLRLTKKKRDKILIKAAAEGTWICRPPTQEVMAWHFMMASLCGRRGSSF